MKQSKIAIIGSGAAAFGIISKLLDIKFNGKIQIIDNHDISKEFFFYKNNLPTYKLKDKNEVIKIHKKKGFNFPPLKCHFGLTPNKLDVRNSKSKLNDSSNFGGLTTFWGGSFLPFTELEFRNWKINRGDLDEYYKLISKNLFISGDFNELNKYYGNCFENNPSFNPIINSKIVEQALSVDKNESLYYYAGTPKLALKFSEHIKDCHYPGVCNDFCNNHNIFKAHIFIGNAIKINPNISYVNDKVIRIALNKNIIIGEKNSYSDFDKIYICAGAINTSKIILNTFEDIKSLGFQDNTIIQTPMYDLNKNTNEKNNFDFTQMHIISKKNSLEGMMFQLYFSSPYLFEYYIPSYLKNTFNKFATNLYKKILWIRGYSRSDNNNNYIIKREKKDFSILLKTKSDRKILKEEINKIKEKLRKKNILSFKNINLFSSTSSHYGCSIPYGDVNFNLKRNGEVSKNIFISDSSVFNTLPSTSPTFTIMANAARTLDESL